jgi:hypothetical protein
MLDLWRDKSRNGDEETVPKSVAYRATSPLYVGEPYRILLEKGEKEEGQWTSEIWDSYGKVGMKGIIIE